MRKTAVLIAGSAVLAALGAALFAAAQKTPLSVSDNVAAVLEKRCVECHSGAEAAESLNLSPDKILEAVGAPSREVQSLKIIDAENPESSYLLKKILGAPGITGARMPRLRKMPKADIEVLKS
jgi:S-adenosylhomocysteine hydrolase